jgi:hypothetical protein
MHAANGWDTHFSRLPTSIARNVCAAEGDTEPLPQKRPTKEVFENMRHLRLAAIALLVLPPSVAGAASSWQPATAMSASAGVDSKSTFVVQAYITVPNQCYAARIISSPISMHEHRYFTVEQMAPSSTCSQKTAYKCTVVSPSFPLPIPHKFEVDSKDKKWQVALTMETPAPMAPMCRKG